MRTLSHAAVLASLVLGCSVDPCWAQHMNAAEAPCRDVVVTSDVAECFDEAARRADKQLNTTYAEIRLALGPQERQDLEGAERAWLKYRDAACVAERRLYEGGTAAIPAYTACIEEETRQHSSDLRVIYGWRIEKARR